MTSAVTTAVGVPRSSPLARRAFSGAAAALFVLFMGNNLPSALYGLVRGILGFSPLTQTLLYAAPVILVILPGLLIFGTLSDVAGRRALVLGGLAAFAVGDAAFMLAGDTTWLFVARLAQGLGVALATAASTATLSDSASGARRDLLRQLRRPRRPGHCRRCAVAVDRPGDRDDRRGDRYRGRLRGAYPARHPAGPDSGRGVLVVQGNVTVTPAGAATIHTYTAPETGWRANSHVIELASQVVLFDAQGRVLFTGGITDGRGHEGDNPGLDAALAALGEPNASSAVAGPPAMRATPVYGCPLMNDRPNGANCSGSLVRTGKDAL